MTELRVVTLTWEADGVLSVGFADPSGGPVPSWTPGAHVDVELSPDLRRSYSLCGDPADDRVLKVAVLREPAGRGGSEFVHTRLRPGTLVPVSAPLNTFELVDAPSYLFIAGGIGITPVLPMLAAATARGVPWRLLYGGRRRAAMAFLGELSAYGTAVDVRPEDEFGRLDLDAALKETTSDTLVYCCGPESLLAAVELRCAERGRQLRVERFAAKPRDHPLPAGPFEVVCERSGVSATVGPDQSVLSVLQDAGVPVPSSCQDGICGTCETTVLEGELDHRDSVLT